MNVFPQLLQKFSIHNCSMIMTLQTIADQLSRRTEPPENISVNDHIFSQHFRFQFQMQCYAYIHKRSIELNSEYYYILYGSWADRQLLYFICTTTIMPSTCALVRVRMYNLPMHTQMHQL